MAGFTLSLLIVLSGDDSMNPLIFIAMGPFANAMLYLGVLLPIALVAERLSSVGVPFTKVLDWH